MRKLKFIVLIVLVIFAVDIGRYFVYPDIGELKKTNPMPSAFMERLRSGMKATCGPLAQGKI